MGFKESLVKYREKTESAYINFLVNYKKDDDSFHLFYEGRDDYSFYTNYINSKIPNSKFTYCCNGKRKLHKIYSSLNWDVYSKNRVLFFTDKDYSDILKETWDKDENIFVTTYYSIENYLPSPDMLQRVIKEGLGIDEIEIINFIQNAFEKANKEFIDYTQFISSWIIVMKRAQDVVLNDVRIEDLFTINDNLEFKPRRDIDRITYLTSKTKLAHTKCYNSVKDVVLSLRKEYRDHKCYTRGKFEISFFVQFINKIPDNLNVGRKSKEKTVSFKFNLTAANAVEYLGPRLDIPSEIADFLEYNQKKHSSQQRPSPMTG